MELLPNVWTLYREQNMNRNNYDFPLYGKNEIKLLYKDEALEVAKDEGYLSPKKVKKENRHAFALGAKSGFKYFAETHSNDNEGKGSFLFAKTQEGLAELLNSKKRPISEFPAGEINAYTPAKMDNKNISKYLSNTKVNVPKTFYYDGIYVSIGTNTTSETMKIKKNNIFGINKN